MIDCPVCSSKSEGGTTDRDAYWFNCPNCGSFEISRTAHSCISRLDVRQLAILSHGIWLGQSGLHPFAVTTKHLEAAEAGSLPNPAEQLQSLLKFIGDAQQGEPGKEIIADPAHLRAKVGALSENDVEYLDNELRHMSLLRGTKIAQACGGKLTMGGWAKYEELKKGHASSRTAFMAMPFGNPNVVEIVDAVFRGAVEETGFRLKRVDDEPKAGSIINRIRVEILTCRFVIADLTNNNNGAYWEAGFAEGKGKPVIYSCSREFFTKPGIHFDIKQSQAVL